MQHLDEGTIHAWLDGELPPEQAADVERHARTCAECAALVADARGLIAGAARIVSALDDVPAGVIPPSRSQTATRSLWRTLRLTPFRAALAASLMLAVASMLVVRHAPQSASVDVAPVASPAPARGTVPASVTSSLDRIDKSAIAAPRGLPRVAAPTSAARRPAAAAPTPEVAPMKTLAQNPAEPKAAAVSDSSKSRADAKDRVGELRASAYPSAQTPMNQAVTAGAAPVANAANATERDVARREAAPVEPITVVTSADDRPIEAPGCYQIVRDSVGALPQIPQRFSLEFAEESGVRQNVVRAVNAAGQRDSVLAGVTWRLVPGSTRLVSFVNESRPPVMMLKSQAFAPAARSAARGDVAGMTSKVSALPRISRLDCR
jgi:hypothetical protein